MFDVDQFRQLAKQLKAAVGSFDPDVVHGRDAAVLVQLFSELERLGAAAKLLAARRVEETNAYVGSGHRDAASFLASTTGSGRGEAVTQLATARRLEELPQAQSAFLDGKINATQAAHIARAGEVAPESVSELLRVASRDSFDVLVEKSRAIQASGSIEAEAQKRRRQAAERMCRIRTRPDGTVSLWAVLLPEEGAELRALHQKHRDRIFRAAQQADRRDSSNQYDAAALMGIVRSSGTSGSGQPTRAEVHLIVDFQALKRGYRNPSEEVLHSRHRRGLSLDSSLTAL